MEASTKYLKHPYTFGLLAVHGPDGAAECWTSGDPCGGCAG
jgi:hypothetical protein